MKRTAKIAAIVSGAAIAAGAFAVPALASGPGPAPASQSAQQAADRQGPRNDAGNGTQLRIHDRDGTCGHLAASGTLSAAQRAELISKAQSEKLAHDLYAQFYEAYHLRVFSSLGAAEENHLQALRTLMERYGITDPTAGQAAGHFSTQPVQAAYERLLGQGKSSQQAALTVTRAMERDAIAECDSALNGLTASDARQILENLRTAEARHLTAITNWM